LQHANTTYRKIVGRNMLCAVAKRTQPVAPNNVAICCVGMLRSFGWGYVPIENVLEAR